MKTNVLFLLALMLSFAMNVANAQDAESEARFLIAITHELENLKALSHKAAASSDESQRIQFDYQALQRDLEDMRRAIETHVNTPSRSPRLIGALNTSYMKVAKDE
jgi:RAQPRD family integrative conjugative element protein